MSTSYSFLASDDSDLWHVVLKVLRNIAFRKLTVFDDPIHWFEEHNRVFEIQFVLHIVNEIAESAKIFFCCNFKPEKMTTLEMDSLSNIFLDPMMISSEDKLDLLTTTIEESEIFSEQHEVKFFWQTGHLKIMPTHMVAFWMSFLLKLLCKLKLYCNKN